MSLIRTLILISVAMLILSSKTYAQDKLNIPAVMEGACPFECCTYTTWTARNDIKVYNDVQDSTSFFQISKGKEFKALTGNVYITEPGLVIAKKPFVISEWEIEKNDTLFILDYQGEGYYNVFYQGKYSSVSDQYWYNRRINEPDETEFAKQVKTATTEWWVKIVDTKNREGWIFMKQAQVNGHDACG